MSTPNRGHIPRTCIGFSNMISCSPKMRETLQEFVNRVMREKGLSTPAVERASHGGISQSHVNRIQNAEVTNPSTPKLKALAKGLGVPEAELFAIVRGVSENNSVITNERLQTIGFAYEKMPRKKKAKADYLIDMLEREIARIENEPE